jgi:hypothetical protein
VLSFLGGAFASLFSFLICIAEWMIGAGEWLLMTTFNLLLAGLMALLGPLLSLLPVVTLPSLSLGSGASLVNYFFPLDVLVTIVAIVLPIYLALPLVLTGLRWLRVTL